MVRLYTRLVLNFPIATGLAALRFSGEDAGEWLQGQVTQDIFAAEASLAFFCNASGQIQDLVVVCREPDSWLVFCHHPDKLLQRVEDFVVMEEVFVSPVAGSVILTPTGGRWRVGSYGFDFGDGEHNVASELLLGWPSLEDDFGGKVLASESGDHLTSLTLCHTKGCYLGQEVIHRVHARGRVNRVWTGLVSEHPIPVGARIGGGQVLRSAEWEGRWIASALLRVEFAAPGTIVDQVTVQPMPLITALT